MSKNFLAFPLILIAASCTTAPSVVAPPCDSPELRSYDLDHVAPPLDANAASQIGFDLDGDGDADDAAGTLLSAMLLAYDDRTTYEANLDARLADDVPWTITIARCPSGEQVVTSASPGFAGARSTANAVRSTIDAPHEGEMPLGALSDLGGHADAGWQPVDQLQTTFTTDGDALDGRLGGVLIGDYRSALAASYAPYVTARLAAGQTDWGAVADHDGDGVVTVDEVLADPTFQAVTRPDLDLDGDGVKDAMSFAFAIHGVQR
jgi:hypothetical protein